MQTVRTDDGDRYLLVRRSGESSRVRDPATGEERSLATERLETLPDESALDTAASAIPEPVRRLMSAVPNNRALGLLREIDARGPVAVRDLLGYDLCESDLHGLCGEFRAAELIEPCEVAGERGYRTTADASTALATLREE
ncbi:hypothetical protein C448_06408 [Halococcus morrhuae DSM 1307]|uniref:Uncharacterized protein n=1 Tax=Halococcus morrhuae DSM 1307 TaxID=931277 RepID=M0ML47_HALMO|nr:hypothetical protein [Halococcus morrhuae]EMA46391.1 hypothetical protein C448_06408 [Halococcus morrhuae DSM 1307]